MRVFVAIDLPGDIKNKIAEMQKKLEDTGADVKFVEKENIHITLLFLGEVSDSEIKKISGIVSQCTASREIFALSIKGAGYFGRGDRISTLWIGIEKGMEKLIEIINSLHIGLGVHEDRETYPHVTIGRVRSGRNKDALVNEMVSLKDAIAGETVVKEIKLKKSVLTPKGPEYADIHIAKLKENYE